MENNLDLSIILPVHTTKQKDFNEFFTKSIKSIQNQILQPKDLIIVHSEEDTLVEFLNNFDFGDLTIKKVLHKGEPNYSSQINLGVKNSDSKWVSFFEFDDEYSQIWFKNVKKYSEVYSDVDAFLPIVVDVDNKMVFAGFTNEATYANNFSMEIGFLTNDTLHQYQNFQTAGMVIKRNLIEDFGGFKPSFELTFVYEFLLRMTYNSVKIMTIPKVGYRHMNLRENSIFHELKFGSKKMDEEQVKFWVSTAKKEYFFTEDRNIKYVENV